MLLEWEQSVGPNVIQATGFSGTYVINNKGETSTLYLMKHNQPLCPINKERAEFSGDYAELTAAQEKAQELEDRIQQAMLEMLEGRIQEVALKIVTKTEEVSEKFSRGAGTPEDIQDREP